MSDSSDAGEKRAWMKAVLGVAIPERGDGAARAAAPPAVAAPPAPTLAAADPGTPLAAAARDPRSWTRSVGAALQGGAPPAALAASAPIGPKTSILSRRGKKIEVVTGKDGRVALTTEPPPVQEITFSGGGGKGAALPGAVKALAETGMLAHVKCFHGASVGSMTAAVLAAGMVPLRFKGPWYKRTDFTGFIGGTVNFDMPEDDKLKLQGLSETATLAHIKNRSLPETRNFASAGEMLSSLGRADLEAMAESDFPGAADELKFRDDVAKGIAALEAVAPGAKKDALAKGPLQQALQALDDLGRGNPDRLAYVGRELNDRYSAASAPLSSAMRRSMKRRMTMRLASDAMSTRLVSPSSLMRACCASTISLSSTKVGAISW
jgi:hypothetical protein